MWYIERGKTFFCKICNVQFKLILLICKIRVVQFKPFLQIKLILIICKIRIVQIKLILLIFKIRSVPSYIALSKFQKGSNFREKKFSPIRCLQIFRELEDSTFLGDFRNEGKNSIALTFQYILYFYDSSHTFFTKSSSLGPI